MNRGWCDWIWESAAGVVPAWVWAMASLGDPEASSFRPVAPAAPVPSPPETTGDDSSLDSGVGTAGALARARDALTGLETGRDALPPRRDARFRPSRPAGVQSLVARLDEVEVSRLPLEERRALLGAASQLIERLQD
jgi:hypothetical protein